MIEGQENPPEHPGLYIRREVLKPKRLSVTEGAKLLGVGRPAFSNLLNGNASLSAEMAVRIEKSFGVKRDTLLQMQAAYNELQSRWRENEILVRPYTPNLMEITASQLSAWAANHIHARQHLPVLLRRLIQSTGGNLTRVDFPGFDNAERPGWDGRVATDTATPWIPSGISGWEFGCNQVPHTKAEADYQKRSANTPTAERKNTTFVFATPHNWPSKEEWAEEKRAEKKWKDVRAFDASDLEQWLEQSVPAQAWMAEELGIASAGLQSLDDCWEQWADVTEPKLSKELFRGSIDFYKGKFEAWLQQPPASPLVISAPSREEGLAFLAAAFDVIGDRPRQFYDRAIAIRSVEGLKKTTSARTDFIAILASPDAEYESGGLHRERHTIIVRTKRATEGDSEVTLDLLDDKTFSAALGAMGLDDDDVARLRRESGQSATVLRRRISEIPAIRVPPWAQSKEIARKLIPLCFVGAWDAESKADQEILYLLADKESYANVEEAVAELLIAEQTPVWIVSKHRGIISKVDVLYAIHPFITPADLDRFFFTARYVLSEKDPALDLPEDKRWAANLYGKSRNHSRALRDGLCETLVLLAVHGQNLFERLGINIQKNINAIVRDLLTPPEANTWASQQSDLPLYAEAAPDQFIEILERDLNSNDPQVLALLKPSGTAFFGGCPRSGLLWALECLAWKPQRLLPVAYILARLSEQRINDNWTNKPEHSLEALFSSWVPQTAATIEQRLAAVCALKRKFPKIVWQLCMEELSTTSRVGSYSYRPRWRNDAFGAGQFAPNSERNMTLLKAIDIVVNWPTQDQYTLGELVERLPFFPEGAQEKVWDLVREWAASHLEDGPRALLRERIRRFAFTRRSRARGVTDKAKDRARELYDLLTPRDAVVRNGWLFAKDWVEESLDELEDDEFDFQKREKKIGRLRSQALAVIWQREGYEGIFRLCDAGDAAFAIGSGLADGIIQGPSVIEFLHRLVSEPRSEIKINGCIHAFLRRLGEDAREATLRELEKRFAVEGEAGETKIIRVLTLAPFRQATWRHLENLPAEMHQRYWGKTFVAWDAQTAGELREIIDQLVAVKRPLAALNVVHMNWAAIDSPRLVRLLREVAKSTSEPPAHFQLSSYEVSRVLTMLGKRSDVPANDLAQLEFIYLQALDHSEHGIPNLERQLSESPSLFMQALGLTFRRSDGADDPVEWLSTSADNRDSLVTQMYTLLTRLRRIPGTQPNDTIDAKKLHDWIVEVRSLCRAHAREEVGDRTIGGLLAHCKVGADGVWPCVPVRQVLEELASKEIGIGVLIGVHNKRGAMWRGAGGQQERDEAAKYRAWSRKIAFESPTVSQLLERIAQSFEQDAKWHDNRESLRRRLAY
jgi:addiction module HigA family antidote